MDKEHILAEIRRTAEQNGGVPVGRMKFQSETGISETDCIGRYWTKWSEALAEAGYSANQMQEAYDVDELIEMFIALIRDLGRYPTRPDMRLRARREGGFPSGTTFRRHGNKAEFAAKIVDYCRERDGYEDILELAEPVARTANKEDNTTDLDDDDDVVFGYVYLLKHRRDYKIGRSNSPGRRNYEVDLKLPGKVSVVHEIKTDDPVGIEAYWHKRFADKREKGEWFNLTRKDVTAFKRRKFM